MVDNATMNKQIPLLFTYRDRVVGMGFSAYVATHGRVLAVQENEKDVWIYGVEPGALAANGPDPKAALEAFRESFTNVLRDFASECHSFGEFESTVKDFFHAINKPNEQDWKQAVQAVRAGQIDLPGARREPAESVRFVQIQQEGGTADQGRDFSITGSQIKSVLAA